MSTIYKTVFQDEVKILLPDQFFSVWKDVMSSGKSRVPKVKGA